MTIGWIVEYFLNSAAWAALGAFGARYLYRRQTNRQCQKGGDPS